MREEIHIIETTPKVLPSSVDWSSRRHHPNRHIERWILLGLVAALAICAAFKLISYTRELIDLKMRAALRNAQVAMEASYLSRDSYDGITERDLERYGYRPGNDISLSVLWASRTDFALRACADGGNYRSFKFESFGARYLGENIGCWIAHRSGDVADMPASSR